MLYALILVVANASGTDSTFVVDYNLTRQDCFSAALSWSNTIDQYTTISCEPEQIVLDYTSAL